MAKKKVKPPATPVAAEETRRQKLTRLLEAHTLDFEELRRELGVTRKLLEEELGHLARSVRAEGKTLEVEPSLCVACGYRFEAKRGRPFHAPKRCPACKEERVAPPAYRIV